MEKKGRNYSKRRVLGLGVGISLSCSDVVSLCGTGTESSFGNESEIRLEEVW